MQTLAGAKQYQGIPTICKLPLTVADLLIVSHDLVPSTDHDDLLFHAQLNAGFTGLLLLGELTWPNHIALQDYRKVTLQSFLKLHAQEYMFWLPTHKADTIFEGNRIIIWKISNAPDPCPIVECYITSGNTLFPFHSQLWIEANVTVPLCSWFIAHLWQYFGTTITKQSMCACHGRSWRFYCFRVVYLNESCGATCTHPFVILTIWLHCSYINLNIFLFIWFLC